MPAVNADLMYQGFHSNGGEFNQVAYWSDLLDWRNQTLTPNPGLIYLMPFINTKDSGPMVLEIPAASEQGSITGNICDFWQCALEDVGPAGVDKGQGGKFLILPLDYQDKVPDGYIVLPSNTYQVYALLRSVLKSGSKEDIRNAVAYGQRVKVYPLAKAANPPTTIFVDLQGKLLDATITYDFRYYQSLDRIVQVEPWLKRDQGFIDTLASIGIKKGQSFSPDSRRQALLEEAVKETYLFLDSYFETAFEPYYQGKQWFFPADEAVIKGQSDYYSNTDEYPITARAVTYAMGFVGIKHLGAGQYYLYSIHDQAGQPLSSSATYRLNVPANAPVKQYWSATLYDRKTHALIRNARNYSISSQTPGIQKNPDGSVDLYFGPAAPAGKESNLVDTASADQFEVLARFYGPEKPLFDKTWQLGDIEKL